MHVGLDRAAYNARKECQIQRELRGILLCPDPAAVKVDDIRQCLKGKERNPERLQNTGSTLCEPVCQPPRSDAGESSRKDPVCRAEYKIRILEHTEHAEIAQNREHQHRPRRTSPLQRQTEQVIDRDHHQQEHQMIRVSPRIEQQTDQEQQCILRPRAADKRRQQTDRGQRRPQKEH